MRLLFVIAILLLMAVPAMAQLYPSNPPLYEPIQQNAYGPGVNSDATGRPFYWAPQGQDSSRPDPTLQPQINQYGYGKSADQYGRPIEPKIGQGLTDFGRPPRQQPSSQPCYGYCPDK
jgi:hypothetical protein